MMNDGSGLTRRFFKNGKNYKRVAVFWSEKAANDYVQRLKEGSGSIRFEPVVERMRWSLSTSHQLGRLSKLGFTKYRVYVPIMEK